MFQAFDGLMNLVSGMGTSRDKAGQAKYTLPTMTTQEALTAYKASALVRRVVDLPAEDATREWRDWQAEADQITAIEAEEKRLGLQAKVLEAKRQARLFGGAALLIGTGDPDLSDELDPRRIKKEGIRYLAMFAREDLVAGDIERDPTLPGYGRPIFWRDNLQREIHPTRLVAFHGIEPFAGITHEALDGWGDTVLLGLLDRVKSVDEAAGNVLSLIYEAKVDVMKIPGLMQELRSRGTEFSKELIERLTLAATAKGISGTLILDALEEYEQKSASFGGLPDLIDRFMQLTSAESGIPMALLFGMSAGGLNASGDIDVRGYYDRVKVQQSLTMQPAMSVLDEALIYSALGNRPPEIHYNWRSLWQPTAKERAETGKIIADTHKIANDLGTLPMEAVGDSLVNALTESGAAPGLEGYVAQYGGVAEGDDDDDDDGGVLVTADAAPRTLYVHRKVLNGKEIIRWAKSQGLTTTLPESDLHVAIAFSRQPVDWMECGTSWQPKLEVGAGGPRQMEAFGDATVLLFTNEELIWRHRRICETGATWDHDEYQPHITISYGEDAPDLNDIEPYQGPIILGPEIFQEVKEDWKEGIAEK